MPSVEELKIYLGIDGSHSDSLLQDMLNSAVDIVENILRYKIGLLNPLPAIVKEALKTAVATLYSNRETADVRELEKSLVSMLSGLRKTEF